MVNTMHTYAGEIAPRRFITLLTGASSVETSGKVNETISLIQTLVPNEAIDCNDSSAAFV